MGIKYPRCILKHSHFENCIVPVCWFAANSFMVGFFNSSQRRYWIRCVWVSRRSLSIAVCVYILSGWNTSRRCTALLWWMKVGTNLSKSSVMIFVKVVSKFCGLKFKTMGLKGCKYLFLHLSTITDDLQTIVIMSTKRGMLRIMMTGRNWNTCVRRFIWKKKT